MAHASLHYPLPTLHPLLNAFIEHLRLSDREQTARGYTEQLRPFQRWLDAAGRTPLTCTTDDLQTYQRAQAVARRTDGRPLSPSTQALRLGAIRAVFAWLERQGHVLADPSRPLRLPKKPNRTHVLTHFLDLQELVAVLQTAAVQVDRYPFGCWRWAEALRLLAIISVTVATGRRRGSVLFLRVEDLDLDRREVRVERDKGQAGMVVPITTWAADILRLYRDRARLVLLCQHGNDYLFPSDQLDIFCYETLLRQIADLVQATCAANPDLVALRAKRITMHSFRVTYASMLFQQGASLRWINELMQHAQLETTSRYSVLELEQLRSVCQGAHPRA